jgi:hypothetical protein
MFSDPCPTYHEDLYPGAGLEAPPLGKHIYLLNCGPVQSVAAKASVTFAMVLDVPAIAPSGSYTLLWAPEGSISNADIQRPCHRYHSLARNRRKLHQHRDSVLTSVFAGLAPPRRAPHDPKVEREGFGPRTGTASRPPRSGCVRPALRESGERFFVALEVTKARPEGTRRAYPLQRGGSRLDRNEFDGS